MYLKLVTVAAAAAFMSVSAYAQSSGGEADNSAVNQAAGDNHQVWSGATGEVFFSDSTNKTMRPQAEWSDRWTKLSDDQRAEVKRKCDAASQTNKDDANAGAICQFVNAK
ncbi:hypothetical protein MNR02_10585 [Shinella sp. H4-D48]|jgi:hypothetical protein|uniref:Uncharacterized protein n=1 Tax=Shinella sedimenti TaxID=2919913 RepID=A0ABT0CH17_9HYPH|nr:MULTISPECIES: hypothetical protein [Shinella]MCJ8147912.1 hypothetical protein [Shinella sedimenti]UNK36931.1 hypothetical protein MNR02_10585 [Shinella sp. H4-D48]